jgi:hypothetical protein
MSKEINKFIEDEAVDEGFLQDWYMNAINEEEPPIWTEEHIYELTQDFIIIPKSAIKKD